MVKYLPMDIHHLRVFLSVYKNRSFTKASEELNLSQPTVSDHVRSLEDELACVLFDRLARTIKPTKEAELLFIHASEVVERVMHLREAVGNMKKEITGELVIGASTIPGTYILPGIAAMFRQKNQSVFIEIVVSDSRAIIDRVAGHELLVGIVGSKLESKHVHYEPFLDDELIAVTSGVHEGKKSISIREIAKSPIVMREQGSGTRREFEKILEKEGADPDQLNIVGIFGSTDAVKQAVKEGMGISIISRRSVKDELKCGMLREIRIKDVDMKRQFYIITHRKRTLPHLYKVFVDYLLKK